MSDPLTELHNDVREMRQHVLDLLQTVTATNTKVDLLSSRLYSDGDGGAIPILFKKNTELDKKVSGVATELSNQRAYAVGYGAGAAGLLTLAHYLVGKLGLHF